MGIYQYRIIYSDGQVPVEAVDRGKERGPKQDGVAPYVLSLEESSAMDENLLLTNRVLDFRRDYPEVVRQWGAQLFSDRCDPDLYYCWELLEEFPKLKAHLSYIGYRTDFAVNAHLFHIDLYKQAVFVGHSDMEALEIANAEIALIYQSLNEGHRMVGDPLSKGHWWPMGGEGLADTGEMV